MQTTEGWETPQKILVILAHPDDPEFFCGASIARWASQGHSVHYCLLTRGDKGTRDPNVVPAELAARREQEQQDAACILGVKSVRFLNYPDGFLFPDLQTRGEIVRVIREEKPDVIVTSDPTNFFPEKGYINHADHRYAGQVVTEAVYPAPFIPHYYPEQIAAGLEPHEVKELWLSLTVQPDVELDVTEFWEQKIHALLAHKSQIGDPDAFFQDVHKWHTPDSTDESPRYIETFRTFNFR